MGEAGHVEPVAIRDWHRPPCHPRRRPHAVRTRQDLVRVARRARQGRRSPLTLRPFPTRKSFLTLRRIASTCPRSCLPLVKPESPACRATQPWPSVSVVPMASTLSSMQADPRFDDGVATTGSNDPFTDVEEAVARLVHASFPPDARARGPASDGSAAAHISQSFV